MSSRWDKYRDYFGVGLMEKLEMRMSRPGNRDANGLAALDNFEAELQTQIQRDRYFKKLDKRTEKARAIMEKAHGDEDE